MTARRACRCAYGAVAPRPAPDTAHGRYRQRGQKRCSVPGRTMVSPNGLSRSLAIFATVLLQPTPMEHVTPALPHGRLYAASGSSGAKRPGVISIGFVDGYALNARRHHRHDLRAPVAIKVPVRPVNAGTSAAPSAEAMAEYAKRRASYEHVDTTPRESA